MSDNLIGYLILVVVFSALIAAISIVIHRDKKKKEFVENHGVKYDKLNKLNNLKINVENVDVKYSRVINYRANSKRNLDNINLFEIVVYNYENDINNIKTMYGRYVKESNKYSNYLEAFNHIMSLEEKYDKRFIKNSYFKTVDQFIQFENKYSRKLMIKHKYKYNIIVNADYISPKGQNHWFRKEVYDDNDVKKCDIILKRRNEYQKTKMFQRSLMTDSLRYDVLKRDNFRCAICGARAADGAELEVDHIIPVSKGGLTEMSNLQTLCKSCNRGKSNK